MSSNDSATSLREQVELVGRVVIKRLWLIVLAGVISGGAALFAGSLLTPVYETSTTVRINKEATITSLQSRVENTFSKALQAEVMWFTSPKVLEPVIKKLALDQTTSPTPLERTMQRAKRAANRLLGRPNAEGSRYNAVLNQLRYSAIKVTELPYSRVLEVKVQWNDPEIAANIANTLVDEFIEEFRRFNFTRNRGNVSYLKDQLSLAGAQLGKAEEALLEFQKRTGIVSSPEVEQASTGQSTVLTLVQQKQELEIELMALRAEQENTEKLLEEMQGGGGKNNALSAAMKNPNSDLRKLLVQPSTASGPSPTRRIRATLAPKPDASPDLLREELVKLGADPDLTADALLMKLEAAEKEAALSDSISQNLTLESPGLQAKIALYEKKLALADKAIENARAKSESAPDQIQELTSLEREKRVKEGLYVLLSEKYAGAVVDEKLELYNVGVFDPAQVPAQPIKPAPLKLALIGVFMGCLIGTSSAFAMEYLDDSLRTAREVEDFLGLPVLAEVPRVRLLRLTGRRRKRVELLRES